MIDLCDDVLQRRNKRTMFVINQYNAIDPNKTVITIAATAGFVAGIKLVFASGTLTIDWKDGSAPQNFTSNTELTHTYVSAGTYYPEITGNLTNITSFVADTCKIQSIQNLKTGNLTLLNLSTNNLSEIDITNIGTAANAQLYFQGNQNLRTFKANGIYSGLVYIMRFDDTDLEGTLDFSRIPIWGYLTVTGCEKLTGINFKSSGNNILYSLLLYSNNLDYVDMSNRGFSFAFNNTTYRFDGNGMSAGDVNHMLYDFNNIATPGYTGRTINAGGTNADPDNSSGGYDGLAAKTALEGKGFAVPII